MASALETPTPTPAPSNVEAVLQIAVDHNGPDNRASDALQRLRGEDSEVEPTPKSAPE